MSHYRLVGRVFSALLLASLSTAALGADTWTVEGGTTVVSLNHHRLDELGLTAAPTADVGSVDAQAALMFAISAESTFSLSSAGGVLVDFPDGAIRHEGGLVLDGVIGSVLLDGFAIDANGTPEDATFFVRTLMQGKAAPLLELRETKSGFDHVAGMFLLESAELVITPMLATALGDATLAGASIGSIMISASVVWTDGEAVGPTIRPGPDSDAIGMGGTAGGTICDSIGPDVIVGVLPSVANYNSVGNIDAFAVGTTSCNIGDAELQWVSNTVNHPVIGQSMYRLNNGRFEHVGQSWLKHGFFALQGNSCGCGCTSSGTGSRLGVGCSDPYDSGLNGSQGGLGPKFEVNAFTGAFAYPFGGGGCGDTICKRIQVHTDDLDPSINGGGTYFVEGHYVTPDDAAAGNHFNNASYRQVSISGSGTAWNATMVGATVREKAAIRAWKDTDPTVTEINVDVPGEGRFIVSAQATDLGGGQWHYEYAVHNLNSDRSGASFSVPVLPTATVTNIGFHDVDYHSGDGIGGVNRDGTDWAGGFSAGAVKWQMPNVGANSNALRWGTLYNFRFDADVAPSTGFIQIGLFVAGSPGSVSASTLTPAAGPPDCQANGIEDQCDLDCGTSGGPCDVPGCGGSLDCNGNTVPDECETDCNVNGVADDCDITDGRSRDCNGNTVPDECETFAATPITTTRVATGFSQPTYLTAPAGDASRLFVVEQGGVIKIVSGGSVLPTPYLDISALVLSGGEQGLLSMAFHPNYDANGFFYVNYTNTSGNTVIARYTVSVNADVANAGSALILKTIAQDFVNHNGGQLQFGPDSMLYIGMGDGGGGNDPNGRAQDTGTLLGKMLRLDVDAGAPYVPANNPFVGAGNPLDEIWATGLRNPWRFSFDATLGDMYIGDVGQDAFEELDFQPAASAGGENYGWRCMEGLACTGLSGCTCNAPALTPPILDYPLTLGNCSIIGGYVYRGCDIPDLSGTYFYAEYCANWIKSLRYDGTTITEQLDRTAELSPDAGLLANITSFGEDGVGELYLVAQGGDIFKIVEDAPPGPFCGDGVINQPSEQCEPPNTATCDANCQLVGAGGNDNCVDAIAVADGSFAFDTTGMTTDGPAHSAEGCTVSGDGGQTYHDIWYTYLAACHGNLTVTTCNQASYDTDLVIYDGTDCANLVFLGCEDDTGGCAGFSSTLIVPVVSGQSYLIRVGGWANGSQGAGTLTISNDGVGCGLCGNGVIDMGEECEPPNTAACDANCQNIACQTAIFEDHFETDMGWTVINETLSTGAWTRVDPTGSGGLRNDPTDDFDGAGMCYVTGNGLDEDIDGGPTRLLSPTIDMSAGNATLSYAYWYQSTGGVVDTLEVEVSADDGGSWLPAATHTHDASGWLVNNVSIDGIVTPTATMRIRFSTADNPNDSVGEAAIDAVFVSIPCGADCNNNGTPDDQDISSGTSFDCDGNGIPDECETKAYKIPVIPPLAIPDGTGVFVGDTFNVLDSGTILDLNLDLVITHTYNGDLIVKLTHNATTVVLINRPGGGGTDNDGFDIRLDDEGTGGGIDAANNAAGVTSPPSYVPSNPLSAFDGMDKFGDWMLEVSDNAGADLGTLDQWALRFENIGTPLPCGDALRGGLLWDKWWIVNGVAAPTGDHPLYPPVGIQTGSTTYRCKECHGWDYKGASGAYGAGTHFTGIPGVFGSIMIPSQMFDIVKLGSGSVANGHGFGTLGLIDTDINDLVAFMQTLVIDTDTYIDGSAVFLGDEIQGQTFYTSGGTISCITCHGADGTQLNFGTPTVPEWVGTIAVHNPWELLHKIRVGQPGSPMPTWLGGGGNDQGATDIGRYCQTFPVECLNGSHCDDGIACTTDSCDLGTNLCVHTPNDALCANGVFCDGAETCNASLGCLAGTAEACDDGVSCTVDSCDGPLDACVNTATDAFCNNGLFCDGEETCHVTLDCQAGVDPCPTLPCDEVADLCIGVTGACCLPDGVCDDTMALQECDDELGSFAGDGISCAAAPACVPVDTLVTCQLLSSSATAGGSVVADVFIENIPDLRGFEVHLQITRTSGTGTVTVPCPNGVAIDPFRPDNVFFGIEQFSAGNCILLRAISAIMSGGVVVGPTPGYLADYTFDVSADATVGSTFEISVVPWPTTLIANSADIYQPYRVGPACVLTITDCNAPTVQSGGGRHLLVTPDAGSGDVALLVTGDPGDPEVSCLSQYVQVDGTLGTTAVYQSPAAWVGASTAIVVGDAEIIPGTLYSVQTDCGTVGSPQLSAAASGTTSPWGDINLDGLTNLDDLLDMLDAAGGDFSTVTETQADLLPCVPDFLVNLEDVLGLLDVFGDPSFPCSVPCP